MKIFAFIFPFLLLGFNEYYSQKIAKKEIKLIVIDTVKIGIIGEPEASLEITTRINSKIRQIETKYWDSDKSMVLRIEYYDSIGRQYKQVDKRIQQDEKVHSYNWYDTTKEQFGLFRTFLNIDSTFNGKGKLIKISRNNMDTELIEYYDNKNKIFKRFLSPPYIHYSLIENGKEYLARRSDIPITEAEWGVIPKKEFDRALKLFYEYEILVKRSFKEVYKFELK